MKKQEIAISDNKEIETFTNNILQECQSKGFTVEQVRNIIITLREKANEAIFSNSNNSKFVINKSRLDGITLEIGGNNMPLEETQSTTDIQNKKQ